MNKIKSQIILKSFSARLREIDDLLIDGSSSQNEHIDSSHEEETLRKLMVVELPKFRRNINSNLSQLINTILLIKEDASSLDLRYLDAWNIIYEELKKSNVDFLDQKVQCFLLEYKSILSAHIEILKSE